jgi:hypothetical protein
VHERLAAATELALRDRQRQQAYAAVDVVADAAGRDDTIGELRGGDASDRKTVALVDVRHRKGRLDDARKRGDILELLERPVADDGLEELLVGEHASRHAHVGSHTRGDLPEVLIDPDQLWSQLPCRVRRAFAHRELASSDASLCRLA